MIEGVGHEYMDDFFGCCESLLAQDGVFVLQVTYIQYINETLFTHRHGGVNHMNCD
jgi:cyclopropane fatty-acyl-phospholipid synthase-like methyltransferase